MACTAACLIPALTHDKFLGLKCVSLCSDLHEKWLSEAFVCFSFFHFFSVPPFLQHPLIEALKIKPHQTNQHCTENEGRDKMVPVNQVWLDVSYLLISHHINNYSHLNKNALVFFFSFLTCYRFRLSFVFLIGFKRRERHNIKCSAPTSSSLQ